MHSPEQSPREPEDVRREEDAPERGNLNLLDLFQLLERNPYYADLKRQFTSGMSLDDLRRWYAERAETARQYLELIGQEEPEDVDEPVSELDAARFGALELKLEELGLTDDDDELAEQQADLEQVVDWIDGVREVVAATAQVPTAPAEQGSDPEQQRVLGALSELEQLGRAGNGLAEAVAGQWHT